jgi:hypothetical protein
MSGIPGKAVACVTSIAVGASLVLDSSECRGEPVAWCNRVALEPTHGPHRDQPRPWNPSELSYQIWSTARALPPGTASGSGELRITLA